MAAPVDIQLRNAQSSILFMQQEHAQTLQGLHSELQKLQKKCAELTFELAMKEGAPDEEHYLKQQKVLEAEIKESKADKHKLEEEVKKKERRIVILEQQLKVQEKKLLDDIKQHKQRGMQYKSELDKKSEMIAHLTSQLHQFNRNKHKRTVSLEEENVRTGSPQPPREPCPSYRRPHKQLNLRSPEDGCVGKGHRPVRTVHTIDGVMHEGASLTDLRQQYAVTRSKTCQNSEATVDVSAFLVQSEPKEGEIEVKVAPPVLPPILSGRGRNSPHHPSPAILAKKDSRLTSRKDSQSPEKHTLAVKKVFSGKKNLCQLEESKSD